jgi:HK97 family phage major capsid protein
MTIDDLIRSLTSQVTVKLNARNKHAVTLRALTEQPESDTRNAEYGRVLSLKQDVDAEIDVIQERRSELETQKQADAASRRVASGELNFETDWRGADMNDPATPKVRTYGQAAQITRQPSIYGPQSGRSFLQDAYNATVVGDSQAGEYFQASQREARADMEARSVTSAGFAGLVIPQYLAAQTALAVRNGRAVANLVNNLPIPDQGMTFTIPRATSGASAAAQATENTVISNTDDAFTNLNLNVSTVAGYQGVSRQSLERGYPGLDQLIETDLAGAYASAVDNYVINGTGASGQTLGFLNTAGIGAATAFGAAPTWALFNSKLAGQVAGIAALGAGISAKYIAMHPRRWGWLNTLNDGSGRPIISPVSFGPNNAGGINAAPGKSGNDEDALTGLTICGYLQGLPVVTDPNLPSNVGTNLEDVVLVIDSAQSYLFEDSPMPTFLSFEQTQGNALTTLICAYGYVAFSSGRYPASVGKIGGLDTVANQGLVATIY